MNKLFKTVRKNLTPLLLGLYLLILYLFILYINLHFRQGIPHVPDEAAYLFMAKMFALGHLTMPIPVSPQHFTPPNLDFLFLSSGRGTWLFPWSFGHPLLLAVGVRLGVVNAIPPLVGVLAVLFTFLIARKVYDIRTAVFTILLFLISPFFLENSASFMSHNSASLYLMISVYLAILASKISNRFRVWSLLSGIFLGLLFNTRPLTALAFLPILLVIFKCGKKPDILKVLKHFFIGLLFCFILWCLYNFYTTGSFFTWQYYLVTQDRVGIWSGDYSIVSFLVSHIENFKLLFDNFGPMLLNWPVLITYGLLFIPFVLRKNSSWDNLFFISLFVLPFAYFFVRGEIVLGTRWWYEMLPFFFLLCGHSLALLSQKRFKTTLVIFYILMVVSLEKLFGFIPTQNPSSYSPLTLNSLYAVERRDSSIINVVKKENIHNSVVFVGGCGSVIWRCFGSVFSQNSPNLDTDVVYARDLGSEKNKVIFDYFQGRSFYLINYESLNIRRVTKSN